MIPNDSRRSYRRSVVDVEKLRQRHDAQRWPQDRPQLIALFQPARPSSGCTAFCASSGRPPDGLWRIADGLDYWLTLVRLRILDAVAGPLPEMPEDKQRGHDRERVEKAFPKIER
jgi:hypothetical protein